MKLLACLLLAFVVACKDNSAGAARGEKQIDITVKNQSSKEVVVEFGQGDRRILSRGESESSRAIGVDSRTVCLYEARRTGSVVEAGSRIDCRTFRESGTWTYR